MNTLLLVPFSPIAFSSKISMKKSTSVDGLPRLFIFFGGYHTSSSDTFAGAKVMIQNLITQLFKQITFDTGFIEDITAEIHNGEFEELCWLCALFPSCRKSYCWFDLCDQWNWIL